MHVHYFESTGRAYDATQCDEAIRTGDVLVIESEGVVGIADTWPFAITAETGNLHEVLGWSGPSWTREHFVNIPAAVAIAEQIGARLRDDKVTMLRAAHEAVVPASAPEEAPATNGLTFTIYRSPRGIAWRYSLHGWVNDETPVGCSSENFESVMSELQFCIESFAPFTVEFVTVTEG